MFATSSSKWSEADGGCRDALAFFMEGEMTEYLIGVALEQWEKFLRESLYNFSVTVGILFVFWVMMTIHSVWSNRRGK